MIFDNNILQFLQTNAIDQGYDLERVGRIILQEKVYISFVDLKVRGGKSEESTFMDTIYPGYSKIRI